MNMGKMTEEIAAQRGRLFLWAPVFFGGGIGLYFALLHEPVLWAGMAAVLPIAVCLFAARVKPVLRPAAFLLFLFALGFATAQMRTYAIHAPMIKKKLGPVEITATIDAIEALEEGKGARLLLSNLNIERLASKDTPKKSA